MNNGFLRGLLLVLAIIYAISPVDLMSGPIDDLIVIALTYLGRKKLEENPS